MRILPILIVSLLSFSSCQDTYKPKYKDHWVDVDKAINSKWEVFVSTNDMLPHPFTDALEGGLMYYWDLYFIQKGLLLHREDELALSNLNNLLYQVETLGFIPNAQASWGLDRSQPPFLSMIIHDYYFHQPSQKRDKNWLRKAYESCLKEYQFWTDTTNTSKENHTTPIIGLQRYYHHAEDSVLAGVYDAIGHVRFKGYPNPQNTEEKIRFGANVIAECESGYDFTPRFQRQIIDYIPLELNVNLWKYEMNFIAFEQELGITSSFDWESMANNRKSLINRYCWDKDRGIFKDYNFVKKELNPTNSYATFYPLLWGLASKEQAEKISKNLYLLEKEFGIIFCEQAESPITYQWDSHSIWPPVQYVVYKGLANYGFTNDAKRIAMKYLDLVTKNYVLPYPNQYEEGGLIKKRVSGNLYEKYDSEGNILDKSDYPSASMIGWCGGVFADALTFIKQN